jgi:hypothetical protein
MSARKRKVREPSKADFCRLGLVFIALSALLFNYEWPHFIHAAANMVQAMAHMTISPQSVYQLIWNGIQIAATHRAQYESALALADARTRFPTA